ncbi:hypothetical protein BCh11DRAFT_03820 [Burkholderia sp. Ch1-1]|nr:hypothetical protein BCh11DRAFT_03820 [Burkholderia sp. Ch1-1]
MPEDNTLANTRERFHIPDGVRYFDGNSLGLMPKVVQLHASNVITHEWGNGLISSWHSAEWRTLPQRAGAKLAALIGARPDEVVACDSTSVSQPARLHDLHVSRDKDISPLFRTNSPYKLLLGVCTQIFLSYVFCSGEIDTL